MALLTSYILFLGDPAAGQPMRAMSSKETDEQSKRNTPVKNRGKGKKADSLSPQHGDLEVSQYEYTSLRR